MKRLLLLSILIAVIIFPDFAFSQGTRRRNVYPENMGQAASIARNQHRKPMANGEIYDENSFVGAHRSLPFGTIVRLISVATGIEISVTIKDRGPYSDDRLIDVSYAAAKKLRIPNGGSALVQIKVLGREATQSNHLVSNAVVDNRTVVEEQVKVSQQSSPPPPAPAGPSERRVQTASQTGKASYYADRYHGRTTASGELYDKDAMTAAHRTFPFGTKLRVTNLESNQSVEVVVNDRGPYADNRIIDLSRAAAEKVGMIQAGIIQVRVEQIK